jgi:VanZ family protein
MDTFFDSGRSRNSAAWLAVAAFITFIFATIPLARIIQKYIYAYAGKEFFTYFVIASIIVLLCVVMYVLIFRFRTRNPSQFAWLLTSCGILIYFTLGLGRHPEEAVHFLEYGILTLLVYHALGSSIMDRSIFGTSVLIVVLVGIMDEFIQWLLPSRVWDYRDIGLNALASVIFTVAIYKVFRPKPVRIKISKRSVKVFLCILSIDAMVLMACLLNTPDVVRWYVEEIGSLSWLLNEEPMTNSVIRFGSVTVAHYTVAGLILILLSVLWTSYMSFFHSNEKHKQ